MSATVPYIDKLALLYLNDGKVLCTMSRGKDTWYLPGGKRETGETDLEALSREIKEELAVDLVSGTVQYYGTFSAQAHGKAEGVLVQMTCYTAELSGEPTASSEIERIEFHGYDDDIPKSPVDHLIFDDLHSKGCYAKGFFRRGVWHQDVMSCRLGHHHSQ